ncbi:polysaccharide pyruvyl transferase family protein [Mesobacillus subterraneus]|uniref:polysaccharide pyruvyl transferase family protein n=1 Tax=Mesobacillus subterraneus TaxID=285983 RepID=UPI001CFD3316|nr:polysaccharide pyruvyl transferase family protein [Mesobacillus subterraneus]
MKKKFLVKAYFAMNLGDDLFLKILFDRYPDVEWHLLTASENYSMVFNQYKNVKIINSMSVKLGRRKYNLFYKFNDLIFHYKKYDGLVIIGGSLFMENQAWKEHLIQGEYLPNKFQTLNKKTFIIGANFGPFNDALFLKRHREFFLKIDDICYRDQYSYDLFKDMENVRVAPDVVFNLNIEPFEEKEKSVGFSLIDIKNRDGLKEHYDSYMDKTLELINKYIQHGYKVKLFSFCKNEGDLNIINTIIEKNNNKNKKSIEVIEYKGNLEWFLNRYKTCEVIIGTRFHSIILGFLFEQNVYPILYSDKTYNVLRDLNMDKNYCYIKDIEELDTDKVISTTNKMNVKEVVKAASKQFAKLDTYLQNREIS